MSKRKNQIRATSRALQDWKKLPDNIKDQVRDKLRFLSDLDNPARYAKHLGSNCPGWYEYRVGKYRLVFYPTDEGIEKFEVYLGAMVVVAVIHRNDLSWVLKERYHD